MQTRSIPKWQDTLKDYNLNPYSAPATETMMHLHLEVNLLREYVKELEDFRNQVSELPEAFDIRYNLNKSGDIIRSLTAAMAIQDSIQGSKVIPLYAYIK